MLDVHDVRALDGPNMYDLVPLTLLRYAGDVADIDPLVQRIAAAAARFNITHTAPEHHAPNAAGEAALTWRTPYPETLATIIQHVLGGDDAPDKQQIQRERRREELAPSLEALFDQARKRDLPVLQVDGNWRLGYGVRSWQVVDGETPPWERLGRIPIVAITGTNGKTTTTRLIDHTLRTAGWRTGRTDTDGIWLAGERCEAGDWTGYGGAIETLSNDQVELAVLETARGGLLRRGLAFERCDVAVMTNIADDHLPDRGVSTVAEMARAKATLVQVIKPDGWAVLNADDAHLITIAAPLASAPIIWFSLNPDNPLVSDHLAQGGTATLLRDDSLVVCEGATTTSIMTAAQLPIALGGLARHNIANALAAAGALHALGVSAGQIALGFSSFQPNTRDNPGRLNRFERDGITVVLDYAHNSDGLRVLLNSARPLRGPNGRLWIIYSGTGDRTDEQIGEQAEIIGALADRFIIKRDPIFLRGREPGVIEPMLWAGAQRGGMTPDQIIELDGDEESINYAWREARADDVIAWTVHTNRATQIERLQRWERGDE